MPVPGIADHEGVDWRRLPMFLPAMPPIGVPRHEPMGFGGVLSGGVDHTRRSHGHGRRLLEYVGTTS